ncbi:cell death regulator Aven [Myripristis murdjan]|uniref:Apoptosis, caspase activation inhibitor n=1 Tax=Myripristis murdjan TaxID=586833 RepID=A0A667Z7B6_9TELE|nr:cell death regulator Aven [Myripristis murdjan]
MEGRPSRGRGGSWRRGGGRGNDSETCGGEHRGRGRGGHHRGRGKRDHHRGRGRGGGAPPADFHQRDQDEGDSLQLENDGMEVFSRRKLESNWDRYEESERQEPADDTPSQRGTDYHVLLESAGDSFTQFRFSEEKEWEMDSLAANQISPVFVDLPALAQCLQEVPLHQRLNLEAELLQVSTPVELPAMTVAPKQDIVKMAVFTPPPPKGLSSGQGGSSATKPVLGTDPQVSLRAAEPAVDDADEELDQLLSLQKPVSDVSGSQSVSVTDEESAVTDKLPREQKEEGPAVTEEKMEELEEIEVTPPKTVPKRQEVTEEDLEDWLDSMIS